MHDKIVIANMMRCKNKQSFFALYQIQNKIHKLYPEVDVEFHILWDSDDTIQEKRDELYWVDLIDKHIPNIYSYNRQFFKNYAKNIYGVNDVDIFDRWIPIYHVLMPHYLRRVKLYDYYLIYDDDVLINDDFKTVTDLLRQHIPVLITEPMNANCDKVLMQKLVDLYGVEFFQRYNIRNQFQWGCNAGFQGIDLSIYDSFLSVDRFQQLLSIFDFSGIFNEDGTEMWGAKRFLIDTQQQSFFSLMNIVLSRNEPAILNPDEYYVVPNWGTHPKFGPINHEDELNGWGLCLTSKISHFIGHTQGKGKPKVLLDKIDEYLDNEGFSLSQ